MKHMKQAGALVLSLALLLCGCGSSSAETEETISASSEGETAASGLSGTPLRDTYAADDVFSVGVDDTGIYNPIRGASATNMEIISLMYDTVFTVDENFEVSSDIVTSWQTDDYTWWVFTVDTTIPFTDGSTLTAADVAYSISKAQKSKYYSSRLSCIYACSAISNDQFAISAAAANTMLPAMLNIPIIKYGSIEEAAPAGTGMYQLSENGTCLELFRENRHSSSAPTDTVYLEQIGDISDKISAFEDSRVDIVSNDPTSVYNLGYSSSSETRYVQTTNMHYLGLNTDSIFFSTKERRCAMLWMLDRDYWASSVMNGKAVASALPVLPSSNLYDTAFASQFYYDTELAMAKFTAAGVSDMDNDGELECDYDGICVEIDLRFIVNGDSSQKVAEAKAIVRDLNELGIKTTLSELTNSEYKAALLNGEYDIYYGEIKVTPDWNISCLFHPDNELDYVKCLNYDYADAYSTYLAAPEVDRYNAYQAAMQNLIASGMILPIGFEKHEVLTHRDVVKGIAATQYDIFNKFYEWTINTQTALNSSDSTANSSSK